MESSERVNTKHIQPTLNRTGIHSFHSIDEQVHTSIEFNWRLAIVDFDRVRNATQLVIIVQEKKHIEY